MNKTIAAIASLLITLAACDVRVSSHKAEAQSTGGQVTGGTNRIWTRDGGLCTGRGTTSDPIDCTVEVDDTIAGTGSAGDPFSVTSTVEQIDWGIFGDGSDGAVHFDGTTVLLGITPSSGVYLLNRDIFLSGGTVDVGATIDAFGYRVFDNKTLTINGRVIRNGNTGTAPNGGQAPSNGTLPGGLVGGAGGSTAGGAASAGTTGSPVPRDCATTAAGPGVSGGLCQGGGGGSGASGAGANGGSNTLGAASLGDLRVLYQAVGGRQVGGSFWQIASSGGGGRGDAGNARAGGGGGSGGAYVYVAARAIAGTGSIEAKGGNGGAGASGGNTGGGGGGGGGRVFVVVGTGNCPGSSTWSVDVSGGTGGAGQGTGTAGGNGGAGKSYCVRVGL